MTRILPAAIMLLVILPLAFLSDVIPKYSAGLSRAGLPAFLIGDGRFYRATAMSLVADGDLDLHNQFVEAGYAPDQNAALGVRGEWYPKHSFVLPLVSLPFFAIAGDAGLLGFNVIQLVALGLVIWLCARRHAGDMVAAVATLAYCLGTLLLRAAYNYSPDVLAALIFLCGYLAAVSGRPLVAGLVLGFSVWAKLPNLFLLPVVAIFIASTAPMRDTLRFAAGVAATLIGWAALCQWMFGSPFITPYDHVIAAIVEGQPVIEASHRTFYDEPLVAGLMRQLLDGSRGLLVSAPPIVFIFFGLRAMSTKARAEALLVAGLCAMQIVSFAKYRLWDQSSFGHRFLILTIVLSAIPFAAWLNELSTIMERRTDGQSAPSDST